MKEYLTERYAVRKCMDGKRTAAVAAELGVTQRRVQQICAEYRKTSRIPVLKGHGRWKKPTPARDVAMVLNEHAVNHAGVLQTAINLKRSGHIISYARVYQIMKDNNLVTTSPAKSAKRKWVRFERKHSNAMWHVDWHTMKEARFRGLQLVVYLDDSSRCVVGAKIFPEAN